MFTLRHLTKTYRTGDIETTALDRIDLEGEGEGEGDHWMARF